MIADRNPPKIIFSKGYQLMNSSGKYTSKHQAPAVATPAGTPYQESPAPVIDKTAAFSNTPTIQSNTVMDEAAAKEYALSRGDSNWQQYVEGVGWQG